MIGKFSEKSDVDNYLIFLLLVLSVSVLETVYALFRGADLIEIFLLLSANLSVGFTCLFLLFVVSRFSHGLSGVMYWLFGGFYIFLFLYWYLRSWISNGGWLGNPFYLLVNLFLAVVIMSGYHFFLKRRHLSKKWLRFSSLAWVLILSGFLISRIPGGIEPSSKKSEIGTQLKNIILFTVDALRADFIREESPGQGLPHIRNFSKDAVRFSNYFSVSGSTNPSFASLFTGKNPWEHGLYLNGYFLLDGSNYTLAELLRSRGYRTAAFSENVHYQSGLGQGFQYFSHIRKGVTVNGRVRNFRGALENLYYRIKRRIQGIDIVAESFNWINKNSEQPFFVWIHIYDPHLPYDPPRNLKFEYIDKSSKYKSFPSRERWRVYNNKIELSEDEIDNIRALYRAEVKFADDRFGMLLKFLQENGLYDDALVVFSADHGEALYESDFWIGHRFLYDNVVRIPLIIKLPDNRGFKNARCQSPFSNLYLAQTILDIAGIKETFSSLSMFESVMEEKDREVRDILSFRYHGYFDDMKLAEVAVINGFRKLVFNGSESRLFRLNHCQEFPELNWDNDFRRLENLAKNFFSRHGRELNKQKLSEEELRNLKTLGYIY